MLGHSLGAAAALDFAARNRVARIVNAAPFTTLRDEAATGVGSQLAHLLRENYDDRENVREAFKRSPQVRADIFHVTEDRTIPGEDGARAGETIPCDSLS